MCVHVLLTCLCVCAGGGGGGGGLFMCKRVHAFECRLHDVVELMWCSADK